MTTLMLHEHGRRDVTSVLAGVPDVPRALEDREKGVGGRERGGGEQEGGRELQGTLAFEFSLEGVFRCVWISIALLRQNDSTRSCCKVKHCFNS